MLIVYSSQLALAVILVVLLLFLLAALLRAEPAKKPNLTGVTLSEDERSVLRSVSLLKRRQVTGAKSAISPAQREKMRRRAEKVSRRQVSETQAPAGDPDLRA